jgi:hypothetical protein
MEELLKTILTNPAGKIELSIQTGKREFLEQLRSANRGINRPLLVRFKPGNKIAILHTYDSLNDLPK